MVERDWNLLAERATLALANDLRLGDRDGGGLHSYQVTVLAHALTRLREQPGILVAEQTGRGKTQIAIAAMAALAAAGSDEPVRVGILAPSSQVAEVWKRHLRDAFDDPRAKTYMWAHKPKNFAWSMRFCGEEEPTSSNGMPPTLRVAVHYYKGGLTHRMGGLDDLGASDRKQHLGAVADGFLGPEGTRRLDLLVIDEAHLFKEVETLRYRAAEYLFGYRGPTIPIGRALLLSATPFQLEAAEEIARLTDVMRWPTQVGSPDFPSSVPARRGGRPDLAGFRRIIDPYVHAIQIWLEGALSGRPAQRAWDQAMELRGPVLDLLRTVMVRTSPEDSPVQTRYGNSDPNRGRPEFQAEEDGHGLTLRTPLEQLLFLAWDGSIASRTTFIATEQQTLASSIAAARRSLANRGSGSGFNDSQSAPAVIQQAYDTMCLTLSEQGSAEHVKVAATVEALVERTGRASSELTTPTLVFAERLETLAEIQRRFVERCTQLGLSARCAVLTGQTSTKERERILERFNGRSKPSIDVLLASEVAGMGLDIDGLASKQDIWLIHHDMPWNPSEVEQRNGRVYRPGKGNVSSPVWISYPYIRNSVDERIFTYLFLRQARGDLLLGCHDPRRLSSLVSHDRLVGRRAPSPQLREQLKALAPDLSPAAWIIPTGVVPEVPPAIVQHMQLGQRCCPGVLMQLAVSRASESWDAAHKWLLDDLRNNLVVPVVVTDNVAIADIDVAGRRQFIAMVRRRHRKHVFIELFSLAAIDPDAKHLELAADLNAKPGYAGLTCMASRGDSRLLVSRTALMEESLGLDEWRCLVLDVAQLADTWERETTSGDVW